MCFADCLSPIFQVSLVFVLGTLDSSCRQVFDDRIVGGCFQDTLEQGRVGGGGGGFPGSGRFMCVLALLLVWYYGIELIPLSLLFLLLFAFSMTRGQEETSTSQAGRRRRPRRDTPSASSLISSLSMEELRSYCQIPNTIDFEFLDGPTESTINEEDSVMYFTRE